MPAGRSSSPSKVHSNLRFPFRCPLAAGEDAAPRRGWYPIPLAGLGERSGGAFCGWMGEGEEGGEQTSFINQQYPMIRKRNSLACAVFGLER